jgi:hypothetical protein
MNLSVSTAGKCTAAILATFILSAAVAAQGQPSPTFTSGSIPSEGNTHYLLNISSDKKAGTIIFDAVERHLDGIGAPLFASQVFSISIPLTGAEKGVKLGVFLLGAVFRAKGTDASLITTVNGRTSVMDFAKLAPPSSASSDLVNEDCSKFPQSATVDAVRRKTGAKQPEGPKRPASKGDAQVESDSSFMQCILLDAPPTSDLRINVILVLNRQNRDTAGYLNVAVIDFSIQPEAKAGK